MAYEVKDLAYQAIEQELEVQPAQTADDDTEDGTRTGRERRMDRRDRRDRRDRLEKWFGDDKKMRKLHYK